MDLPILKGRGAQSNPPGRFERLQVEDDPDQLDPAEGSPRPAPLPTQYFIDKARTIITTNDSPDVAFDASINPYRGCAHGCIYCYARQTHEYLDLSAGLDFETKIFVKVDAPRLLREELASPRWRPQVLGIAGVTDAYQPVERRLRITRQCLEVLAEFRNPVAMVTKSRLITRDIDLLADLARFHAAEAYLSITTLDHDLSAKMEPRAASPQARLDTIRDLSAAGIPTGVLVAPIIPGLTDHEVPAILSAARQHGAAFAGHQIVRLPFVVKDLLAEWLERHFPHRKEKVLNRIRSMRDGKLNCSEFHDRMTGHGLFAEQIDAMFDVARRRCGYGRGPELSTESFRPHGAESLFD